MAPQISVNEFLIYDRNKAQHSSKMMAEPEGKGTESTLQMKRSPEATGCFSVLSGIFPGPWWEVLAVLELGVCAPPADCISQTEPLCATLFAL